MAGFGAVAGFVVGHDRPGPGLSTQGLVTIVMAAAVVVLLTIHRATGSGPLARAVAEYAVVAVLAALLTLAGGVDQPLANSATRTEGKHGATGKPSVQAGDDRRPGVLRVAAGVARAVTTVIRAVTGAASWLADLWRQADAKTDRPSHLPPTTTPKGDAMAHSPAAPSSTRRSL